MNRDQIKIEEDPNVPGLEAYAHCKKTDVTWSMSRDVDEEIPF
jgi:hypothetical protein